MESHHTLLTAANSYYLAHEWEKVLSLLEWTQIQEIEDVELQADLCFLLGQTLKMVARDQDACHCLEKVTEICPDWLEPFMALGQLYFDLGEHEKSLAAFRNVVRISPEDGSSWLTIAHIAHLLKNQAEAIQAAREVLQLDPGSDQARLILAESLRMTGHCDNAIPHYEEIIRDHPNHIQALYGYGQSLLATGDLPRGWIGFEARRLCEAGTWGNHFLPDWDGEAGKLCSVLAYGEGGIASEIQFASCLPDLARQAGHCFVECNALLRPLFERSFPDMTVISQTGEAIVPDEYPGMYFDAQVAFGSLPRFFRTDFEQFPQTQSSYLIADRQKTANWKRLFDNQPGKRKIGILVEGSWSTEPKEQCRLSYDCIGGLLESASPDDVSWVGLQHGSRRKDWLKFCQSVSATVGHYPEVFGSDLDELAAMIAALDLVIAPSGFQAHLAAALGVPCWVVLPEECDWRWHLSKNVSPWYPSVRLFRQKHGETWGRLMQGLLDALHSYLSFDEQIPILPYPVTNAKPTKQRAKCA